MLSTLATTRRLLSSGTFALLSIMAQKSNGVHGVVLAPSDDASSPLGAAPIKSKKKTKLSQTKVIQENVPLSSKVVKLKKTSRKSSSSSSSSLTPSAACEPSSPLDRATRVLKDNGLVALPTDTLYGLAGLAQSTDAVKRIYNVKERHNEKPLSICVGDIDDVYKWAKVHCDQSLLRRLLPGPVTLLFDRRPELNPDLNPGVGSIGVRIPDNDFIRHLCLRVDEPLALTSANASATQSTLRVEEFEYLWPKIDLVVDGGPIGVAEDMEEVDDDGATPSKRPRSTKTQDFSSSSTACTSTGVSREGSTVVDLSRPGRFRIVRPGSALENTVNILKGDYQMEEDE